MRSQICHKKAGNYFNKHFASANILTIKVNTNDTTVYRSSFKVVAVVLDFTGVEVAAAGTFLDSDSDS